jgi:O-antigen/teichoic acid export membrane protein
MIDSIRYEVTGMLLIAAVIGGASMYILQIFGPGFARAEAALALLMLYPALAGITVTQTQALWATDRPGLTSWIAGAKVVVTLGLLIVLTPSIGITGPAIAQLSGEVVSVVLAGIALRPTLTRPLRETWRVRERFALLLAYATGFAAAHAVQGALPFWPGILAALSAGSLAFVVVLFFAGGLNHRDRGRFADLLRWLRSRNGRGGVAAARPG